MKTITKILAVSVLGIMTACSNQTANQNNGNAQGEQQTKEQAKSADTKAVEFPDIDIKELNKYFSDVASAHLSSFEAGKLHDTIMIDFAVLYSWINAFESFKMEEGGAYAHLSDKEVDKVCLKFFGQKPNKHQSVEEGYIKYENGEYLFPCGDGEGITFAIVDKLIAKKGATAEYAVTLYGGPDDELENLLNRAKWNELYEEEERPDVISNIKATLTFKDGKYYVSGWQVQK